MMKFNLLFILIFISFRSLGNIQYTQTSFANHCKIYYNEAGLIKTLLSDEVELSIEDIISQRNAYKELVENNPHVILVIAGHHTSATKEARDYAATNPVPGRMAEAIVIKSMSVRILGNVFINFHKPSIPTKMFNKEEDALEWLSTFLNVNQNRSIA